MDLNSKHTHTNPCKIPPHTPQDGHYLESKWSGLGVWLSIRTCAQRAGDCGFYLQYHKTTMASRRTNVPGTFCMLAKHKIVHVL